MRLPALTERAPDTALTERVPLPKLSHTALPPPPPAAVAFAGAPCAASAPAAPSAVAGSAVAGSATASAVTVAASPVLTPPAVPSTLLDQYHADVQYRAAEGWHALGRKGPSLDRTSMSLQPSV